MIGFVINQMRGIFVLSFPLLMLAAWYPTIFQSWWGILAACLGMALYVVYFNYKSTSKHARELVFEPTGDTKEFFEAEIRRCGLSPQSVRIRYGFTDLNVAMALLNTIKIDPLIWKNITTDQKALEVKKIIETYTVPYLPEPKKQFLNAINNQLNSDAQMFIFRHELAHVVYQYTYKYLSMVFLVTTCVAVSGIMSALFAMHFIANYYALAVGMIVAGVIDVVLTYGFMNPIFKYWQETSADLFAARYSTPHEIIAAAEFFEKYGEFSQEYKERSGFSTAVAQRVLTGHPDATLRGAYLRKLAYTRQPLH